MVVDLDAPDFILLQFFMVVDLEVVSVVDQVLLVEALGVDLEAAVDSTEVELAAAGSSFVPKKSILNSVNIIRLIHINRVQPYHKTI